MPGITRIHIINEKWNPTNDRRLKIATDHESVANSIYREIFPALAPGEEYVEVTKEEAAARYDYKEGVDVILTTVSGMRMTVQEKVLTYHKDTITFEEKKGGGDDGAWYYCTAQLYFVGYSREYKDDGIIGIQNWIMIKLASLRLRDDLPWKFNRNDKDGRRASFRYLYFDEVPNDCIVARKKILKTPSIKPPQQLSFFRH